MKMIIQFVLNVVSIKAINKEIVCFIYCRVPFTGDSKVCAYLIGPTTIT